MQTTLLAQILDQAFRENRAHGLLYLNNPKVGCSTIKSSLWTMIAGEIPPERRGRIHLVEGSPFANTLTDPAAAERAFVFTFVRNPFQRLVSAWLDKVQARRDKVWAGFATRRGLDPEAAMTFDAFVELLSGIPPEEHDPHWRPQHLNILYPFVRPNLIGDLDHMDQILPQVLTRLFPGWAQVVQSRSHRTAARAVWSIHLADPATLVRVQQIYAADFDCFGYAPDLAADPASQRPAVWSDHGHPGLARLVTYLAAEGPARFAALNAVEAADSERALQDWVLQQRLRQPRLHQMPHAARVAQHAEQIATGPAYLQRAAEARGQG